MDKNLIAVLADHSRYKALLSGVNMDNVGTATKWMLQSFGTFFKDNPKAKTVDYSVLRTMALLKVNGDEQAPVLKLIDTASKIKVSKDIINSVQSVLVEQALCANASKLILRYEAGDEVELAEGLYREAQRVKQFKGLDAESLFEDPDIHEILAEQAKDVGLKFPQIALAEGIKGLVPPCNIGVAAAVDSGKTSLMANWMTAFAPQVAKDHPGRPILWLSNEGVAREIWPRVYSAALNMTGPEMAKLTAKELYSKYEKAVGGDRKIIRILDVHGWTMAQAAALIEEMNPYLVVFDMIANFRLPGVEKRHEKMEQLTQEARELEAIHDFIGFHTLQLSADGLGSDGKGMAYPPLSAIKDSKIGAQGAFDIVIMMGKVDAEGYELNRYLSTPKNKRKMVGRPGNVKAELFFNPDTATFTDA